MTETKNNSNRSDLPPTLSVDWEAYGAMLDASDVPEGQKRELIETLWSIVTSFVDLGFGVHPVQQACGEDDIALAEGICDMLHSLNDEIVEDQTVTNPLDRDQDRSP